MTKQIASSPFCCWNRGRGRRLVFLCRTLHAYWMVICRTLLAYLT